MGPKLTYANVTSTLCLFLLLGGGAAYAASHLGKNSVGTKQLKKNAVSTAKIKKEAVTAAKVKKGTLTGKQINVSTLGTIPNALHADSATNAVNAVNATNFSRFGTTGVVAKSFDNENVQSLADGPGPFHFEGVCVDSDGDQAGDTVYAAISSSVAGAFVYSAGAADVSGGSKTADIPLAISPVVVSGKPTWGKEMSEFTASTPDGSLVLRGFVEIGTQVFGGACAYDISWIVVS